MHTTRRLLRCWLRIWNSSFSAALLSAMNLFLRERTVAARGSVASVTAALVVFLPGYAPSRISMLSSNMSKLGKSVEFLIYTFFKVTVEQADKLRHWLFLCIHCNSYSFASLGLPQWNHTKSVG